MAAPRRQRDRGLVVVAALAVVLCAGGIAVYAVFVADDSLPTYGPSMRPTLQGEVAVEIDSEAYEDQAPEVGDIVSVQAPAGIDSDTCGAGPAGDAPCASPVADYSDLRVIKRIVAGPGDAIAFAGDGIAIRDGARVDEPYALPCGIPCPLPRPITVPAGHYFLAGDNRGNSSDSRIWGPVGREAIDGRVLLPDS